MADWVREQPWLQSYRGLIVLAVLVLIPLLIVAVRRGVGAGVYARMGLHLVGVLVLTALIQAGLPYLGVSEERAHGPILLLIAPLVAFLWGFFRYWPTPASGDVLKRGARVEDGAQASRETAQIKRRHGAAVLTLAGVAVPFADEAKHFKLIGTTGAGKSTAIRELLDQALARGDRAVIADPDGGYLSRFYDPGRGDVVLNPFDARSRLWDPFADLAQAYDADLLARALIPGETEWHAYARTFVAVVLKRCKQDGNADGAEFWRLVSVASSDELRPLVAGTPAQPYLEPDNARMFGSLRSVASTAVAGLEYVNAQGGVPFSVREWVKSGQGVLFMPYQAEQIAALRALIATWLRLAIFQTMSLDEKDHRLWFVVDELDALGHIDGLKDALARLRKFGGRCVLGFQSIAQVSTVYGPGPAKTIVENCSNSLILRCSTSEGGGTAQFASALIGKREVIRQTVTRSTGMVGTVIRGEVDQGRSFGEHHLVEDAVMASEIEALPDRVGYLKFASGAAWHLVQLPFYVVLQQAAAFEAAGR